MYVHRVFHSGHDTMMGHFRETTRPSGLVTTDELARTFTIRDPKADQPVSSLAIAEASFTAVVNDERSDGPRNLAAPHEEIFCEDLSEFVRVGNEKWNVILNRMGHAGRIGFELAKVYTDSEQRTDSGIILPEHKEIEFVKYVAHTYEIEALEQLTLVDGSADNASVHGGYL